MAVSLRRPMAYRPRSCPVCESDLVIAKTVPVVWKVTRLVAVRIEVTEELPAKVQVWMCGDCGYIISRLYRKGEITSYGAPEREAYYIDVPITSAARFNYSSRLESADRARTEAYSQAKKRYEDAAKKAGQLMDEKERKKGFQKAAWNYQEDTVKARMEYNKSVTQARMTYERSFLHYLVSKRKTKEELARGEEPKKPVFHEVQILEARRVIPPFPMSSIIVKIGQRITYTDYFCDIHQKRENVETFTYRSREYTLRELQVFSELIWRKRPLGLIPQAREGVLAYLVASGRGTASLAAGFMRASNIPEYRAVSKSTVGQALSRIQKLGLIPEEKVVKRNAESYRYWWIPSQTFPGIKHTTVPVKTVLTEKEYILRRDAGVRIRRKPRWWQVLDVKKPEEAAKELGLEAWL